MRFTCFCLLGGLLFGVRTPGKAQSQPAPDTPPSAEVERVVTAVAVNYLGLSASQERRLGSSVTATYGVGAHYSFYSTAFPIGGTRFINVVDPFFGRDYRTSALTPYLLGELRLYHTLFRRTQAGRNTRRNAANYFALFGEVPLSKNRLIDVPNLALATPVGLKYGLRRNLGGHLYAEGSAGLALKISRTQRTLLPRLDAALAWCW
ncbi:hypothetical protein EJV47_01145 [Hymenobacter gummosus]|uniref:DUF3575 domain-containing protein n=1 Tax=Hymenobacter gummosus TaxID=1776032 RepID=A0A431U8K8_9BACT|nr:hypothetical protein [Hymenobacter gummosus]RTQ53377.1 hypothetical protein EJV47_01145 [Hymenobacter gummosus]